MRKFVLIFSLVGLAALPVAALASQPSSTDLKNAAKFCKDARTRMGLTAFRLTYGKPPGHKNAFGKCVSGQARAEHKNASNAAQECKDLRASDPAEFTATYGAKHNAFGKCVSTKAKQASQDQEDAVVNAARKCKAERSADPAKFASDYGTRRNAFGKCVSHYARATGGSG
jgi:hypothetical protein